MKKSTLILKAVPAALLALGTQQAMASGFQLLEQNASGLGNAYAGSAAVAENASTIYYNPAGMTYLGNQEYSVGLNLIQPTAHVGQGRRQGQDSHDLGGGGDVEPGLAGDPVLGGT